MPKLLSPEELFALVVQADEEKRDFVVAFALSVLEEVEGMAATHSRNIKEHELEDMEDCRTCAQFLTDLRKRIEALLNA